MAGLDLPGASVVVTGGGSGIGAALVRRLAAEGARVLVSDRDGAAVRDVAAQTGAVGLVADVREPDQVRRLVAHAVRRFGGVDLFCSNAGVASSSAPTIDEAWDLTWQVNVLAHVHAVRALLPRWLAAGRGRLLVTASAAGLLTMLGDAPYAVTKHAAVGLAEWLRASYAHRGITVHALCPQGVDTAMLAASGPVGRALLGADMITPEAVAQAVVEALAGDRFLILPHPQVGEFYAHRATDPDRWLAGMNRLQQRIDGLAPGVRP